MAGADKFKQMFMQTSFEPVLVYTMGKVASSSISNALLDARIGCYDVHSIAPDRMLRLLKRFIEDSDIAKIPPHMIRSLQAYNALRSNDEVKVISLLREPVSRNVSAVFQNLPKRLADDQKAIVERLRKYSPIAPDIWFVRDFIPTIGIDFFDADIDSAEDHFRFQRGNIDLIILKSHMPDARKEALLEDFLGQRIHIVRENAAADKWYSRTYAQVMGDLGVIGTDYVEKCLDCRYFHKFYSPEERRQTAAFYS